MLRYTPRCTLRILETQNSTQLKIQLRMNKLFYFILGLVACLASDIQAQSTAFVLSGGSTIGIQRWDNSFEREPLFQWHGTIAAESVNNDDDKSSLYAQLGYHVKGSAMRFRYWNINGTNAYQTTERFKFNNISLVLGAKQKYDLGSGKSKYFYFGAIRGDYTISTNLDELREKNGNLFAAQSLALYPAEGFVKHFIGGVSVGAGIQLPLSELIGAELKISVNPDFTLQYNQPPIVNVIDPFNPGQNTTIGQRQIRNTTVELSLGLRLLRKVVYE